MAANDKHLWHISLYEFRKDIHAPEATKNICSIYENAVSFHTVKRWLARFRFGDFSLEDKPGSGRKAEFDNYALEVLVEFNPRSTIHEMVISLEVSHTTIETHLTELGKVHMCGVLFSAPAFWTKFGSTGDYCVRSALPQQSGKILPHPPYSPDIAPSDYNLFQTLANFLVGK